jgi:hypothetical protein
MKPAIVSFAGSLFNGDADPSESEESEKFAWTISNDAVLFVDL